MSEIKLNLLDSHTLLTATVHGSVGDALVAALSAEPETIDELEAALRRFEKCDSIPASFLRREERGPIDEQPWDAGILVIDLPARMVAIESTYSLPTRKGKVAYHEGAAGWYEQQEIGLGSDFAKAVLEAIDNPLANLLLHRLRDRRRNVRWLLTKRFPYKIVYQIKEILIRIRCLQREFYSSKPDLFFFS
jgi:hypothetical protein